MSAQSAERLAAVHPKMLAAQTDPHRKPLAEDLKVAVGKAIERALMLAHLEKQEVAYRMGYADQTALARWMSGVERPHFDKLLAIEELRWPLIQMLAALDEKIQLETTIRRVA